MKVWRRLLLRSGAWACTALLAVCVLATVLSSRCWFAWHGENSRRSAFSSRGSVYFRANFRRLPPGVEVKQSDGFGLGWHCGTYGDDGNSFKRHPATPWQWRAGASLAGTRLALDVPMWI